MRKVVLNGLWFCCHKAAYKILYSKSDGVILLSIGSWNVSSGQEWSSHLWIVWVIYWTCEDNEQYSSYCRTSVPYSMRCSWWSNWLYVCAKSKPQPAVRAMLMQVSAKCLWPLLAWLDSHSEDSLWEAVPLWGNFSSTEQNNDLKVESVDFCGPLGPSKHFAGGVALGRQRTARQLCSQTFADFKHY